MNWISYFRNIAHQVKLKSKDVNTKIGAVVVGQDNEIVSTGYNSFPRGINDSFILRQERPEKYYWFEHAERNALYNAARIGVSTKNCKMFLTCGIPCADCARGIINSGITEIYCEDTLSGATGKKWEDHAERSIMMFNEAKVKIYYYSEMIDE